MLNNFQDIIGAIKATESMRMDRLYVGGAPLESALNLISNRTKQGLRIEFSTFPTPSI